MIKKVMDKQRELQMIQAGDRVLAGFSGGGDSVCLLLVLLELQKQIPFALTAVHVEHGIRGEESLRDAAFAEAFCKKYKIACRVCPVDAPEYAKQRGMSLEEAARELRYQCFYETADALGCNKIAVAHHADDCAETMLFHLVRGTGLAGLAGIPALRGRIVRPLLGVTRQEIEEYLEERKEGYCVDSTNEELSYSRNRIRQQVLPGLRQINSRAVEHMVRLGAQVGEIEDYIRRQAQAAGEPCLVRVSGRERRILGPRFGEMEPVLQGVFLLQVLGELAGSRKDISMMHVESLRELFSMETGKRLSLPYGITATVEYRDVVLQRREGTDPQESPGVRGGQKPLGAGALTADGVKRQRLTSEGLVLDSYIVSQEPIFLETGEKIHLKVLNFDGDCEKIPENTYTKWFDYDKIKGNVLLRSRRVGDYLLVNARGNQKKLKEYLINEKVPQSKRNQIPLLAEEGHILWVVGYRISEGYKVTERTKQVLEVRIEKEN